MKKLYFLLFSLLGFFAFGQDLVITGAFDGPLSGGTPKGVEIYVINNIADLSTYGIGSANNGGGSDGVEFTFPADAVTAGSFIYVATEAVEFANFFGFAPNYTTGAMGINGDDAIELFSNVDTTPVVIDVFGTIDCDPNAAGTTCPEWEHTDGWAYRLDSTGPEGSTFTSSNWTYSGTNQLEGGTTNATCTSPFPIGTFSYSGSPCGVALGTAIYNCQSSTIGDNNDGVIVEIPYTGSNNTIVSVSVTGGSQGGDDPALTADGTITISGLTEGDAWSVTLNGGDCDGTTTSGTVPAAECDPTPSTCFDLSAGPELFELVTVASNSDSDVWTETGGTYSMNGFCGGGCMEESNTWLIFGPLDMTGVTDLELLFDATEGFDGTDLNVQYTTDYSANCPDGANWTSALTVSTSGSYSADLSGVSGTAVFVGIQYLDSDGSFSSWDLSNMSLAAFGSCPTLGTRPVSDCAVCDVTLGTESYTCATNTAGDNNDGVTVNIPYTGLDNTIVNVSATGGTPGGDDPALTADGTITISGLTEGDAWSVTLNGGDCDGTTLSGTVPSSQCDPVTTDLVINEIHADPAGDITGDANGDGVRDGSQDEFVELYNIGGSSLDISGFTLEDGFGLRHTFPGGTIIPSNSFITVFGGGTPTGIPGLVQVSSEGGLGLNNGGDDVVIKNGAGIVVVAYTYVGATDQSVGRSPDFTGAFVDHSTITGNGGALFSPGNENDVTLSTGSLSNTTFSVYPNPTNTGKVTISSSNNDAMNVQVFDILGKQVKNETLTNNTLNVSDLNTGVYILKITQNNATTTKKLVIR
ncbi:lamin tail domain-containing protein [Winogradskyella aquimaris]|uniref:Lamin tail domain-containing protein n=1 Tax=Winogradskyella aquimaris TaxID=864074 RepID=A0ABU5EM56_9FLAO|nr:lamin tail domain-containing protein [Winogradskyella aquimaris]MDY2585854.1 lamin tail domain-containing protein [Winogradskyella aquimaris]